jgi:peptide deformylase
VAVRDIRIYGDPVLRGKSAMVDTIDESVRELAVDLSETLLHVEGLGLAAPQIGVLKRVIVVHPPKGESESRGEPRVLVNPRLVSTEGPLESAEEGCLSIPGVYELVKRPRRVRVTALDLEGEEVDVDDEAILARILQHEIDHPDGVLFVDRIGPMRRALLRKRLREFLD